jgi:maltose O-acetyltransferase
MLVSTGMRNRLLRAAGIDLAEDVRVLPGSHFGGMDGRIRLGAGVMVNRGCMIQAVADVTVGARVFIGPGVKVIASTHRIGPREHRAGEWIGKPIQIGEGSWIGAGAMILPGVTIGEGCIVAAGAVVTDDCEADGLYAGIPARRVRDLDVETAGRKSPEKQDE